MEPQKVSDSPMLQTDEQIKRVKQGVRSEDNILEFGDDDIVIVQNILDKPFRFKYEGALYELDPGEQTQLPGFMAWHFLKKFADYYFRHVKRDKRNLAKARARHYEKDEDLFKRLIVRETKIKKPVDAESRGKVIKLEGDAHLDDDLKEDFDTSGEDQVLPEREIKPEKPISDSEFDRGMTEQDKSIEEFAEAKEQGKEQEFAEKKQAEFDAKEGKEEKPVEQPQSDTAGESEPEKPKKESKPKTKAKSGKK